MPAQVSLLSRKVFVDANNINWYSEPMYWGNYQRCEMFLACYGISDAASSVASLIFEGSNEPGYNATWSTIAAGTPADPATLSGIGVARYVRDATLYPYVRVKLTIGAASGLRTADISLDGQLWETSAN